MERKSVGVTRRRLIGAAVLFATGVALSGCEEDSKTPAALRPPNQSPPLTESSRGKALRDFLFGGRHHKV